MNKYTSLKLSKLLADNGFEGKSEYSVAKISESGKIENIIYWNSDDLTITEYFTFCEGDIVDCEYPAYDILNDLCAKYAKEMFGEEWIRHKDYPDMKNQYRSYVIHTDLIFRLMRQNKKDKAEEYIWKHCLFNKNK